MMTTLSIHGAFGAFGKTRKLLSLFALNGVLSGQTHSTPPSWETSYPGISDTIPRPDVSGAQLSDSSKMLCPATKISGTVVDSSHKGRANLWVQDGAKDYGYYGHRTKTDSTGAFHLVVDNVQKGIYVVDDSIFTKADLSVGMYPKQELQVHHCVADPITIVTLAQPPDLLRLPPRDWSHCTTLKLEGYVLDSLEKPITSGVWIQAGDSKEKLLFGPRIQVDTNGAYRLTIENTHPRPMIYFFTDSSATIEQFAASTRVSSMLFNPSDLFSGLTAASDSGHHSGCNAWKSMIVVK